MNNRIRGLQYRRFEFQIRRVEKTGEEPELWVEGRAAAFDSPTVLYECDGVQYREQIARGALDGCDMSDVIFNYNHGGRVLARTRNSTLQVTVEEDGLYMRAQLDGTAEGRQMYEEIQGGYIDRMSFAFAIATDGDEYDRANHLWTVRKIRRLYDVSAVDIPAYDDTSIAARRADAERAALEHRKAAEAAARLRRRVRIKLKIARMKGEFQNAHKKA